MGVLDSLLRKVDEDYGFGMEANVPGYANAGDPWENEDDEGGTGTPLDDIEDDDLFGEDDDDDDLDDEDLY